VKKITAAVVMAMAGAATHIGPAMAQSYPDHIVKIVSPFATGGIADTFSRALAQSFSDSFGQPFIVENKIGGGGNIGSELVAKSPADGYTLVMGNIGSHAVNPFLVKNMRYDPIKDFAPIALVLDAEGLLVVNSRIPANNLREFLAYAKAHSGKLTYGSGGIGTTSHLAGLLFTEKTKIELLHVPYKGNNPAITDLVGGQTDIMFATMPTVLPFVKEGRLKALAVLGKERSAALPDVPTLGEQVPGFEANNWIGLFAPAGTSPQIVGDLNKKIQAIMTSAAIQEKLQAAGAKFIPSTPESFATFQAAESRKWQKILKDAGVEPG